MIRFNRFPNRHHSEESASSVLREAAASRSGVVSRAAWPVAVLAALAAGNGSSVAAQPAPKAQVKAAAKGGRRAAGTAPAYYYNGRQRVELELALDELVLETDSAADAVGRAKAAGMNLELLPSSGGQGKSVRLTTPPGDRGGLKEAARRLAAQGGIRGTRAVLYAGGERQPEKRRVVTPRLAVKLLPGQDPADLARRHGLQVAEKVSFSPDTYVFTAEGEDPLAALEAANSLYESEYVEFATPMLARPRVRRAEPADPLYSSQWHLRNTGAPQQYQGVAGNDVNTVPAWNSGITGSGVTIGVTDDGLQLNHPDLAGNVRADLSIDLNYGDNDPTPRPEDPITTWSGGQTNPYVYDNHGTACAGVAAARAGNGIGGVGAAYDARLAGIRLISGFTTDELEAQALLHKAESANPADRIHINTNSWGPADDGQTLEGPGPLTRAALAHGAKAGRGGRGTIYTWAAGNGRQSLDDVNFDGYANDQHTIAVGATYADGKYAYYSEPGAAVMVNAPSNHQFGSVKYGIVTTDRTGTQGYTSGDYTPASGGATFGGTSSAAPLAAGCIALMLQANPNLTWRDVQQILVETSAKNDPADAGWFTNSAGFHFNHKYGFGRINAAAAVEAARRWVPLMPRLEAVGSSVTVPLAIPDNNLQGASQSVAVSAPAGFRAEHVEVTVNLTHSYRGDLSIYLTSPSGTVAKLAGTRSSDGNENFDNWTFLSLPTWGENPNGTWKIQVVDGYDLDTGTLNSWSIKVHGTTARPRLDNTFSAPAGWATFGASMPEATATFDGSKGALLATVGAAAKNRVIGWRSESAAAMLPHAAAGPGSIVRAKFWLYAGGQSGTNSNQIPNFRLRASTRFAATSILDVLHHSSTDLDGDQCGRDLRPSTSATSPSLYRVDYAPVQVPLLYGAGSQEGVSLGFETYSMASEPQENGYLALTETSLSAYPAPAPEQAPEALIKTYSTPADFANGFYYYTAKLNKAAFNAGSTTGTIVASSVNGEPQGAPEGGSYPLLSSDEVLTTVTAAGVTLDTSRVGGEFIGVAAADFLTGNAEDGDLTRRARVEAGKQYHIRFHATSTQPASRNALIRFRARTAKFQWTQRLEIGGSYAAGLQNNALARQMLPGIGSLNSDRMVPGEAGGWYTVVLHTPLSSDIRADMAPATPLTTSMPKLSSQPGPGVNAPSRRDIFPALDLVDTLSGGPGHALEQGQVTVDRIEIRSYDLVND